MNLERVKIVAWRFDLWISDGDPFNWVQRTVQQNGAVPHLITNLLHVQFLNWHSSLAAGTLSATCDNIAHFHHLDDEVEP